MDDKDPKELKYMKTDKKHLNTSPIKKHGIEEPNVKEYRKLQLGILAFVLLVVAIIAYGVMRDIFGIVN